MNMKNVSCARITPWYPSKQVKNMIFFPIAMFVWRHGYIKRADGVFKKNAEIQENNYLRKKFSAH